MLLMTKLRKLLWIASWSCANLWSGYALAQPLSSVNSLEQQLQQIAILKQAEDSKTAVTGITAQKNLVSSPTKAPVSLESQPTLGRENRAKQPPREVSLEENSQELKVSEQNPALFPSERPTDVELNTPFAEQMPIRSVQEELFNKVAFEEAIKQLLPLTPEQIHRLRQLYEAAQYAANAPAGVPPRPAVTTRLVRLDPGSTAPVIRLAAGFVTTVAFLDSTGEPWPIEAYSIGKPGEVNIQWNMRDNILLMQASELYSHGNMAVKLRNLTTPVMLTLVSGQKAVDYRVDLRVQGFGPHAQPPVVENLPSTESAELLGVLDRIPPEGSKVLKVSGGLGDAWLKEDRLFLRTRLTVLSPGWLASMSSADGMKAYELTKTSTILASHNGKIIQLKIEGL